MQVPSIHTLSCKIDFKDPWFLQMDLQFAIDDMPTTATGFLMRVFPWHRWSKRSRVPSSCCQCQDASSFYKLIFHCAMWLCSIWCWAIPVCPRRYSLSELLMKLGSSQSDSHHTGWQILSENVRERERSNRKSTTIATSGLVFEICAALLWGQEPLLSLSSCFFEKFYRNSSKEIFQKKTVLDLIGMFWFQIACDSGIEEIPTWLPREGHQVLLEAAFYIISHHRQLEFWAWDVSIREGSSPLPGPGTPWSPTIMWCRWRDGWTWRLLYTCLFGSIRIKPTWQFDQADIVSYWFILSYCIIYDIYCYFLLGSANGHFVSFFKSKLSGPTSIPRLWWTAGRLVARCSWGRGLKSGAPKLRAEQKECRKPQGVNEYSWLFMHWEWEHRWSLSQWSLKNNEKTWVGIYKINWRDL